MTVDEARRILCDMQYNRSNEDPEREALGYALYAIDATKDHPEIVRCKDCRKGSLIMEFNTLPYLRCYGVDHELDWFCADGERNDIK